MKITLSRYIVREGSLYGPLYRMEERKLISSRKELVGEKRFRNYYHIEDAGKEYLEFSVNEFKTIFDGAYNPIKGCYLSDEEWGKQ